MEKPIVLSKEEITQQLQNVPGWTYKDDPPSPPPTHKASTDAKAFADRSDGQSEASAGRGKISKEFKFEDFMGSLNFVNKLAPFCEREDHHPDIHIFYSKILFELQRFDIGGKITDKDFAVAQEIERLYNER